jgi:hypothetical protein
VPQDLKRLQQLLQAALRLQNDHRDLFLCRASHYNLDEQMASLF